ncbi:MAG: hypothetical protein LBF02_00160 [Mycoplasmataceae bacterium]|jgi:hypothetical protein|nr:hypothetical protein [Mycoplasmataceae bacterium]
MKIKRSLKQYQTKCFILFLTIFLKFKTSSINEYFYKTKRIKCKAYHYKKVNFKPGAATISNIKIVQNETKKR